MPNKIRNGLDVILADPEKFQLSGKNIAYLAHEASLTQNLIPGSLALAQRTGTKLKKLFGPQHGFNTLDQDNMIETGHSIHPKLKIPVFSLYSDTRQPTDEMLEGIDLLIIDLQDVGTRVYTYIWTLLLCLKACQKKGIEVLVADRPNPIGGLSIEGNLPLPDWFSFVCMEQLPMRHGMTIGEIALLLVQSQGLSVRLRVVPMEGWKRSMLWRDTGLTWVNPSPNLATPDSALVYPGTVLFEGTRLSEGRGTTRSLEMIGHPALDPHQIMEIAAGELPPNLGDFRLRPTFFKPAFDKFAGQACGGFQIHPVNPETFRPWALGQNLLRILYHQLSIRPFWNTDPYEYETNGMAIDYINGDQAIRHWIERNGSPGELEELETKNRASFLDLRNQVLIYKNQ